MIHFYKEQVEFALKLIEIKSKYDDIKASKDITEINTMINTAKPTVEFVNAAKQLDERINADYPEIYYHTFHSTKGLEYENVIIVLGKDFGQDKGLFELFFKEYGEDIGQDLPKYEQYERGRNILYVAVTRAIKNLRILYIDDLEEVRHNIEKIFGKAEAFPTQMT